jgi:hypothetical protein
MQVGGCQTFASKGLKSRLNGCGLRGKCVRSDVISRLRRELCFLFVPGRVR